MRLMNHVQHDAEATFAWTGAGTLSGEVELSEKKKKKE
jgi:hypothetical protein